MEMLTSKALGMRACLPAPQVQGLAKSLVGFWAPWERGSRALVGKVIGAMASDPETFGDLVSGGHGGRCARRLLWVTSINRLLLHRPPSLWT